MQKLYWIQGDVAGSHICRMCIYVYFKWILSAILVQKGRVERQLQCKYKIKSLCFPRAYIIGTDTWRWVDWRGNRKMLKDWFSTFKLWASTMQIQFTLIRTFHRNTQVLMEILSIGFIASFPDRIPGYYRIKLPSLE